LTTGHLAARSGPLTRGTLVPWLPTGSPGTVASSSLAVRPASLEILAHLLFAVDHFVEVLDLFFGGLGSIGAEAFRFALLPLQSQFPLFRIGQLAGNVAEGLPLFLTFLFGKIPPLLAEEYARKFLDLGNPPARP